MTKNTPPSGSPRFPGTGGPGRMPGTMQVEYAENIGKTLLRIAAYFAKERGTLAAMLCVVILGTLCGLCAPSLQSAKLSQGIVRRMRQDLFDKIIDLPLRYLDTHVGGDLMSRMTNDIENISTTVSQSLPSLFSGGLTITGTVAVMLWYCWQLALLSLVTVVLTVLATRFLSKKVRRSSRRRQELLGQLNGQVEEMIAGYRTVTAFNRQEQTAEDFAALSDGMTKAGIQTDAVSGIMGPLSNCIGNIGFVIIAAVGGYFSFHGMISVGVISAFIVYAKQFSRPINELAQIYGQLQTAIAGAERVFYVLDEQGEDKSGVKLEENDTAEVTFRNVNFSYEPGRPVLRDFSLRVPSGKKVALVGATGSGKTTVVNLLMRFYEPDSGDILINGQNLREASVGSLRRDIAIVLQDTVLFAGTVRENLQYSREDASEEQLQAALEASRCQGFVQRLPQGVDTVLTGAGGNLSQGQRQLLAIARAFVADPRILILDVKYSIVLMVYGVYRVREKRRIGTSYTNRKKNVYDVTWKRIRKILKSGIGSGSFFIP